MPHITAFATHSHTSYDDYDDNPYHSTQLSFTIAGPLTIPQLTALVNLIHSQLAAIPAPVTIATKAGPFPSPETFTASAPNDPAYDPTLNQWRDRVDSAEADLMKRYSESLREHFNSNDPTTNVENLDHYASTIGAMD